MSPFSSLVFIMVGGHYIHRQIICRTKEGPGLPLHDEDCKDKLALVLNPADLPASQSP